MSPTVQSLSQWSLVVYLGVAANSNLKSAAKVWHLTKNPPPLLGAKPRPSDFKILISIFKCWKWLICVQKTVFISKMDRSRLYKSNNFYEKLNSFVKKLFFPQYISSFSFTFFGKNTKKISIFWVP